MNKRKCKVCEGPVFGRSDKIFCKIACKNQYYINMRMISLPHTQKIDNILHRNWVILYEIVGEINQYKKVNRKILDKKKFNWHYVTKYHVNSRNKIVNYIYDFSWMLFSDQHVFIKRIKTKK